MKETRSLVRSIWTREIVVLDGDSGGGDLKRRVLSFDEWLGEVERKKLEKLFVRIKGVKDIMVGEVYEYEPWFMDGKIEIRGYLSTQSKPQMDMIHQKITKLGYVIYGFGEYGSEVIVHYRRERGVLKMYRFGVDEKCPSCGWRVTTAYVMASSENETKTLLENNIWLCGKCIADMLVDEDFILKRRDENG